MDKGCCTCLFLVFQEKILRRLEELKILSESQQRLIEGHVKSCNMPLQVSNEVSAIILPSLPVTDDKELASLENFLEDGPHFHSMVSFNFCPFSKAVWQLGV